MGNDPQRAAKALTREQGESRPRISLVANLKTIMRRGGVEPPPAPPRTMVTVELPDPEAPPVDVLSVVRARLQPEAS